MIKKIILVSSLVIISVVILLFIVSNNLDYQIKISSWLSRPSANFIDSNNITKINIKLSDADNSHFERLFKDYYSEGLGIENDSFINYYSNNNKWRKTTLTINDKKIAIKIKSHGRTPYAHKYGKHFSLAIKFKEEPYPFFSKRINLIIYNRIQLTSELVNWMGSKFNLIGPNFELVSANIGDKGDYLFFVEERINKDFFAARKLPMIIFNKGVHSALIFNGSESNIELSMELEEKLRNRDNYSQSLKNQIKDDYSNFNKAIFENNLDDFKRYIDIDYFAKLNAFRIVYGSDGHGFGGENLEMSYDTISRLFYPIVHRDVCSTVLNNCQSPYAFMDSTRVIIPFWILLDSDTTFLEMTKQKLDTFLLSNGEQLLSEELKSIVNYYKSSHFYEFSSLTSKVDGSSIIENVKCLNNSHNTK